MKRNLTNEKARLRNQAVRAEVRSAVRAFRESAETGEAEQAQEAYRSAARKLDKAVSKGVLHKNNAANRKSAMAKRLSSLQA
jgi:small subunit ribosomal protein S20